RRGWPPRTSRTWTGTPRTAAASRGCWPVSPWTPTGCGATRRASTPPASPATASPPTRGSTTPGRRAGRPSPSPPGGRSPRRRPGAPTSSTTTRVHRHDGLVLRAGGQGLLPALRHLRGLLARAVAAAGGLLGARDRRLVDDLDLREHGGHGAGDRSPARGPRRHAGVDVQRPGRLDLLAVGEEGGGRAADRLPRLRRGAAAHRAAGAVLPGDRRRD